MHIAGQLSKREAQIMDLAYARGSVVAADLEAALPGAPSNSAVRTHLRTLETKGLLVHAEEEGRYVYRPVHSRESVARDELRRLLASYFGDSPTALVAVLLDQEGQKLTEWEREELRALIENLPPSSCLDGATIADVVDVLEPIEGPTL